MKYLIFALCILSTTACDLTIHMVRDQEQASYRPPFSGPNPKPDPEPTYIPEQPAWINSYTPCDGTLGEFDVYRIEDPVTQQSKLAVVPLTLEGVGEQDEEDISITVINDQLGYLSLVDKTPVQVWYETETALQPDSTFTTYPILVLSKYQDGIGFAQEDSSNNPNAVCNVPDIGNADDGGLEAMPL